MDGKYKGEKLGAEAIVKALTARYGETRLRDMLNAAKASPRRTSLLTASFAKAGWTSDDVFKMLYLDDTAGSILTNPSLDTWITYVARYGNGEDPYKHLFQKLASMYGERKLADILVTASADGPNKDLRYRAVEAIEVKLNTWQTNKVPVDEVYKLLELDRQSKLVESNGALNMWVYYVLKLEGDPTMLRFAKPSVPKDAEGLVQLANAISAAERGYKTIRKVKEEVKAAANKVRMGQLDKTVPSLGHK